MSIQELLQYIDNKPELKICPSVDILFLCLLRDKCIDFNSLTKRYVQYLENKEIDQRSLLSESSVVMYMQLEGGNKKFPGTTNRALHMINQIGNLECKTLNEKYKYDPEEGKKEFELHYGHSKTF